MAAETSPRGGLIQRLLDAVRGQGLSVVLPEGQDSRILAAARRLKDEGIAEPILLGPWERIEAAAQKAGVGLEGIRTIAPLGSEELDEYAADYAERRGLEFPVARRVVKRSLYFGGMMVGAGHADAMVAGAVKPTTLVIQAGVLTVGLAEGVATPSSFFLMVLPEFQGTRDKVLVYADCALNVAPNPAQLADIALASAQTARGLLDEEPRVAMLSFSSKGSASHAEVDQVRRALEIARRKAPGLKIDGELQADTAIVPHVAARKLKEPSPVAGRANVLIFPDLTAGNIAYKLTQHLAGAQAIGPVLQGFARPISDLSRGASVDDVIAVTAVCLVQATRATSQVAVSLGLSPRRHGEHRGY
jgi:phosphate acetyltransferase